MIQVRCSNCGVLFINHAPEDGPDIIKDHEAHYFCEAYCKNNFIRFSREEGYSLYITLNEQKLLKRGF